MGIHKQELSHRHMPGNHVCHVVVRDTMMSKHYRRDHKESSDGRQTGCESTPHVSSPLGEHPTWLQLNSDAVSRITLGRNEILRSDARLLPLVCAVWVRWAALDAIPGISDWNSDSRMIHFFCLPR